jgi:hypothetical protein
MGTVILPQEELNRWKALWLRFRKSLLPFAAFLHQDQSLRVTVNFTTTVLLPKALLPFDVERCSAQLESKALNAMPTRI